MGSVGPNHRCPWCGRVGFGGYAHEGIPNDLICTEGPSNCLDKILIDDMDRAAFREQQLHAIAQMQIPILRVPGLALSIAIFL